MNANMPPAQSKEVWSVTVLYEDTDVRERAMRVSDHLMRQFWSEIEFDFNWWRFAYLEDEVLASQAASHTMDADALIIAVQNEGDFSPTTRSWLEQAMAGRGVREGAFIALFGGEEGPLCRAATKKDAFLRSLAQRAGMDYLTGAPSVLPGGLPDSLDSFSRRAIQHSSVMDDILRHTPPPNLCF